MESLEQQFKSVLAEIEVDGRALTETEIVHSCVVNNDFAKLTIVLPLESRLRQILPTQIEENIRNLPGISRCLLYTSPSPRDLYRSRMPSSA